MKNHPSDIVYDPSDFVLLADYVPGIIQEIRYYSTYNFIGDRIDGYEEPCALLTKEAARALRTVSNEMTVRGSGYPHEGVFLSRFRKAGAFFERICRQTVQSQPRKYGGFDAA